MTTTNSDLAAVVAALERNDKFLVTSHEAPDGDALGSLLAAHLALEKLGKDSVMFLGGPSPMPGEYTFLDLPERGLRRERPADSGERGSNQCGTSAPTSRSTGMSEAAAGTPWASASSSGMPKPSASVGNAAQPARCAANATS